MTFNPRLNLPKRRYKNPPLSERKYRIIFDEAAHGSLAVGAESGVILECNQKFAEMIGRKAQDIVGQPQRLLHPHITAPGELTENFKAHAGPMDGEILVDRENPQNSSIGVVSADISQFKSDNQRRDNAIRERFLQSSQYPIVEFSPQDIQGLPETYEQGQEITFQVSGDLTIRDVTKPVTFDVKMVGNGDTITGEATTTILMSDYGFGPISIAGILNTEDEVKVLFVFEAQP